MSQRLIRDVFIGSVFLLVLGAAGLQGQYVKPLKAFTFQGLGGF
jgi:hypothetical protein